jgi:class 3 adenylate cyclase/tetratricopeptide (TPR) repeat protein
MRFCGRCGSPLSDAGTESAEPDGTQRRHITVLFSDIVGSTVLAEQLDPEDFRDLLSGYHAACTKAVERYGGYLAQFQGDGAIAYFGYPQAHEDDAARAVTTGLEVLDGIADLNARLEPLLRVSLQVRVGIASGIAITGQMGTGQARERHSAVGGVLNVAARVQTVARPGTVVVTAATLSLVGDVEAVPLGAHELSGISQPLDLYEVHRSEAGRLPPRSPGTGGMLVNRVEELARLEAGWERARAGRGALMLLAGEAGIGKSRLVEVLREHARSPTDYVLRCSPHHSGSVLYPVLRLVERLSGLERGQPRDRQLAALERWTAAAPHSYEGTRLLSRLLSISDPDEEDAEVVLPLEARNMLLRMLERLLVPADTGPLLLVVEDLHWADPTTIELLDRIVYTAEGRPVGTLFTYRTEFRPPWLDRDDAEEIQLGPLSDADVRQLLEAAGHNLDELGLARLQATAEGVPLFVEEMAKQLEMPAKPESTGTVPQTLNGLLAERLDRLPELAGVIDVAAVLGREFEADLAEALLPLDRAGFRSAIARLTAEDVLRGVEGAPTRLEFRHVLLQEAAYERLVRRRRKVLHGRVAELLSSRGRIAWESEPERVAYHWEAAGELRKAAMYWERAGRRALEQAAFHEAAAHFQRAVETLGEIPGDGDEALRGELLSDWGAAVQAGSTPAAEVTAIYARARRALSGGTAAQLVPVVRGEFLFHNARAQYDTSLLLAREMLELAEAADSVALVGEGQFYAGATHMLRGELTLAAEELEASIRHCDEAGRSSKLHGAVPDPGVSARAYLATVLWNQGHADRAHAVSEESLALAELEGGPVTLALSWGMRCVLLLVTGQHEEFARWLARTDAHCTERNIGYWSTVCKIWTAWARGLQGDAENQVRVLERLIAAYASSGGRVATPHFRALHAEVHLAAGARERALASVAIGQRHIDTSGERLYEPELQWLTGRALIAGAEPDTPAATAAFERAVASARDQEARLLELRAATGLALHQRRIGETVTVLEPMAALCEWFGRDSALPDVIRARMVLGEEAAHGGASAG